MQQTPAPNSHVHPLFAGILNTQAAIAVKFAEPATVASMQSIVDGLKARNRANAAPVVPVQPQPLKSAAQLQAELQIELQGFDPAYAFSDDHTHWREQLNKATRIGELRRQLAQGVSA